MLLQHPIQGLADHAGVVASPQRLAHRRSREDVEQTDKMRRMGKPGERSAHHREKTAAVEIRPAAEQPAQGRPPREKPAIEEMSGKDRITPQVFERCVHQFDLPWGHGPVSCSNQLYLGGHGDNL
jgi:hypothetical protein